MVGVKENEPSMADLEAQIRKAPDQNDPGIIRLTRRFLMRKTETKLTAETIKFLRQLIIQYEPDQLESICADGVRKRFKFAREGDGVVLFPNSDIDNYFHIDYAVAAGMTNPDDAGLITVDPAGKKIILFGDSFSLHIPPTNNLERPKTVEILGGNLPAGYVVKVF